jgi:hypothetical protein
VSWQVIPRASLDLFGDPESAASQRAMRALLRMEKLDLAALQRAYDGELGDSPSIEDSA